jgi:hypothetical protein
LIIIKQLRLMVKNCSNMIVRINQQPFDNNLVTLVNVSEMVMFYKYNLTMLSIKNSMALK